MEILVQGQDIYKGTQMCKECGCVFRTSRNDINIMYDFDKDTQYKFYECPSCYNAIKYKQDEKKVNVIIRTKEK